MKPVLRTIFRGLDAGVWATVRLPVFRLRGERRIALASFPRSGNTWLRSLIEEATGLPTGSIYEDRVMPRSQAGFIIKTHAPDAYRYTHAVHIVRNPFDAIPSYFHWSRDVRGRADLAFEAFLPRAVDGWRRHTEHWLATRTPMHRLRFEDLRRRTHEELRSLLAFLQQDVSEDDLERAIEDSRLEKMRDKNPHVGKKFFRKGAIQGGLDAFGPAERELVISRLGGLMRQVGYEPPAD